MPFEVAPEREVYELPMGRLVSATLRSGAVPVLLLLVAGAITIAVVSRDISAAFVLVAPLFAGVTFVWSRINQGANFRAAISPDGIRLRHGLTESRAQTVPPGRVQAIRLRQGPLWRGPDWWRVEINVAGYGARATSSSGTPCCTRSATRGEAMTALWLVLPDLGVRGPGGARRGGADRHGRRRRVHRGAATRALGRSRRLAAARGARDRPGAGDAVGPDLAQSVDVVPHERTQSLGLEQGPIQRRLGLASFVLHSTPGSGRPARRPPGRRRRGRAARRAVRAGPDRPSVRDAGAVDARGRRTDPAGPGEPGADDGTRVRRREPGADDGARVRRRDPEPTMAPAYDAASPEPTGSGRAGEPVAVGRDDGSPERPPTPRRGRPPGRPERARDPTGPGDRPGRLGVGVVGSGRVGAVLGSALRAAGHPVVAVSAISEASRERAATLLPGVPVLDIPEVVRRSELVLLTVPDDALADLVRGLADLGAWQVGQIVVHTSGRFGVDVLAPARAAGVIPLALHPAMTFTGTSLDLARLVGCSFAVTAPVAGAAHRAGARRGDRR